MQKFLSGIQNIKLHLLISHIHSFLRLGLSVTPILKQCIEKSFTFGVTLEIKDAVAQASDKVESAAQSKSS